MKLSRRRLAAAACVLALADPARALMAGAAPDSPEARVDANTPASPWTSAVAVLTPGGGIYSGVVVAPRFVLTASHVAGGAAPAGITVQLNHQSTPVLIGVTSVATFPTASFPYDDLSLITLASPVPDGVEILPIYREVPPPHQLLTLVGYGASGHGDAGISVQRSASVKRTGRNVLDAVQKRIDGSGRQSLFFLYDFDGPTGTGVSGGSSLGNDVETGVAGGDSGGPAYAEIGGQRWLLGINTVTFSSGAGKPVDFRFGTVGGGMLLSDPRFIAWLETQTGGTLGPVPPADGPLPAWTLGIGAAGLLSALGWGWHRRTNRSA
jgi:hypothetical protein